MSSWRQPAGFSLLEMLVAVGLTLIVTAGVFALVGPSRGASRSQTEAADVQQRLRVVADTLKHDLLMAGAGPSWPEDAAAFTTWLPPLEPASLEDREGVFRPDAITIRFVPAGATPTALGQPLTPFSSEMRLVPGPGCPLTDPACGLAAATSALVYDSTAADLVDVVSVDAAVVQIATNEARTHVYDAGARVLPMVVRGYALNVDAQNDVSQLTRRDGVLGAALPVVDHVTSLKFEYISDADATGPRTLAPDELTDGPWFPDGTSGRRFDGDLLRVRRIRVTVELQAAVKALRLPNGPLSPGGAGAARVPDIEVRVEVAPRNIVWRR